MDGRRNTGVRIGSMACILCRGKATTPRPDNADEHDIAVRHNCTHLTSRLNRISVVIDPYFFHHKANIVRPARAISTAY
jgi:hypothetical protein